MSALSKVAKMLAKAADKGLDVSPQARKARAVEQGYVTNKQLKELVEQVGAGEVQGNRLPSPAYMRMKPPSYLSSMNGPFYGIDGKSLDPELVKLLQDDIARQREEWLNAPATFYHGAAGDLSSFNPNYLGRSTKAASANHATFFSNLPEDADYYAQYAVQTNPRLDRKVNVIKDIADKLTEANKDQARMLKYGAPQVHIDKNKEYISRLHRSMRMAAQAQEGDAAPAVYPVHLRLGDAWPVNKRGEGYGDITKHLSTVKNEGGDSVIFFDINDPNPFATHAAVFDPSRIRSIHAMFDPQRINSRDLLASMGGLGALGLTDEMLDEQEPEEYASGGLVKAGSKALKELLENLHKAHPERLARAKEAGFDTSKVWLHGTNTDELINDGFFNHDKRVWTKYADDPELKGFYFTDDPMTAGHYASYYPMMRDGETYEQSVLRHQPSYLPVFLRNNKIVDDEGGKISNLYEGIDWPIEHSIAYDTRDIRSIFNDFTPESLADDKFASGGLVKAGSKVAKKGAAALEELLENMRKADPERLKRAEEAGYDTSKVWLHGTNTDELVNEGAFLKPENWFTDNPEIASVYSQRNPYDLELSSNIIPVFIKDADRKYKFYPESDNPYTNIEVLRNNRYDIRSIFNDFTPESLASEKFASGGLVYPYD